MQAWAVFSNRYHFVALSPDNPGNLSEMLGRLHGATSRATNALDGVTGRTVWFQFWDTHITFERSYYARLRYVHQNPVHHRLVAVASQYPWCSAGWLEQHGDRAFQRMLESFKIDRVSVYDEFEPRWPDE